MRKLAVSIVAALGWTGLAETEFTSEQIAFFETKIRPVLVDSCYECHSKESGKSRGGLVLDTKIGMRQGGNSGEAVLPHDLEGSLLWTAVSWADPDYEMPPRKKLPPEAIADFKTWIEMGAPDPREIESYVVQSEIDLEEGRKFWSFQPPVKAALPEVKNEAWARTEIDQFVIAKLEEENLQPVKAARPVALLRRLSFDLIGLPPSPQELKSFIDRWKQEPEKAIEEEVDRLLQSEQFGERWGRHWLDVARYAESTGKEVNLTFPHAWRYRDYVIDSLNADKPYDQFLREQIAGDLLAIQDDEDWQENLIATGFLALGTKGLNERNTRQFALDLADEQLDATTQAFLGLTVACARCHDHKFDPIPTADYYAMAGIFLSTETYFGTVQGVQNRRATDLLLLPIADPNPKRMDSGELDALKSRLAASEQQLGEIRLRARQESLNPSMRTTSNGMSTIQQILRQTTLVAQLKARVNGYDDNGVGKTFAMGVQDRERPVDANVLVRGELDKPAQQVDRGFLQVLDRVGHSTISSGASGRVELANWISSRENPLTARVMVNRIWQHLFGQGLVTSPNNFGAMGKSPSHPELLDHLAVRFMEHDWSIKAMIRELVLTNTYQLSSSFDSASYARDPENQWLWRATPRRLDAEAIRDSMLAASGQLELERPQGSMVADAGDAAVGVRFSPSQNNQQPTYRSVYLPIIRDGMPEALALFDAADPSMVTAARETTNVPSQSLYLMNNPFVVQQAEAMARLLVTRFKTPRDRAANAFLRTYGRLATSEEIESSIRFFQEFMPAATEKTGQRQSAEMLAMTTFCQALFCSAEFRYLN